MALVAQGVGRPAAQHGAIFPMPTYPNPEPGVLAEYHLAGTLSVTGGIAAAPGMIYYVVYAACGGTGDLEGPF